MKVMFPERESREGAEREGERAEMASREIHAKTKITYVWHLVAIGIAFHATQPNVAGSPTQRNNGSIVCIFIFSLNLWHFVQASFLSPTNLSTCSKNTAHLHQIRLFTRHSQIQQVRLQIWTQTHENNIFNLNRFLTSLRFPQPNCQHGLRRRHIFTWEGEVPCPFLIDQQVSYSACNSTRMSVYPIHIYPMVVQWKEIHLEVDVQDDMRSIRFWHGRDWERERERDARHMENKSKLLSSRSLFMICHSHLTLEQKMQVEPQPHQAHLDCIESRFLWISIVHLFVLCVGVNWRRFTKSRWRRRCRRRLGGALRWKASTLVARYCSPISNRSISL